MKIAIFGTGGVGGYYGGLLARAGHEVTFIARGAHLKAIQDNGLQVKSLHGDFVVKPAQATDDPATIGTVDLVIFCPKTYHTDEAVQQMRSMVGRDTVVMSLQNGVEAAERIGSLIGMEHVIGGVTQLSSAIEAPGVIRQVSQFRRIIFGEFDGSISERVRAIESVLKEAEIVAEISTDIQKALWTKLVFICAASSLGSLTRLPMGDWRAVPETRDLVVRLMKEVEAVGRAHGVNLDADVVEKSLAFIDAAAPQIKASMQLDVAAGRRTEIESMIGVIGRKGRESGILTPVADLIYASLLPVELKARNTAV